MKIEIWSDFACPFCYIGKRRFEQAIEQFDGNVKVEFRSFELDPNAPRKADQDIHDMLAGKYGMTREKAKAMNDQMTEQAKEAGLDYQMDTIILANTHDAHRLSHYAKEQGKMVEFTERIMKAYFTESKHIADFESLAQLAEESGLLKEEVLNVLESGMYSDQVRADQKEAAQVGVRGVPFFVFNEKYAVSGAQPVESFLQVLHKVGTEEQVTAKKTEWCADDDCGSLEGNK
ncbi:disulfide bond formation protein DsbA [Domibacillus aminovorans]|uniref:Disulfide bond formation protein DsbA n=1 Tax=Domibacillus aminovorans TaxID=29332 RepID=A0A177KLV8_9BACI|nr:DsbA family oxidoreductase [Domibacillus aminovorans]OAH54353.1 disulfide bond formation protein DsbA [Domibacillus aminovorans]